MSFPFQTLPERIERLGREVAELRDLVDRLDEELRRIAPHHPWVAAPDQALEQLQELRDQLRDYGLSIKDPLPPAPQ